MAFTLALEQPTVCGLLHITSSLQDICQAYPYEKRNVIKSKKTNIKKLNKLKWPHSEDCLMSFSNSNWKECQFCTLVKHAISKYHRNTPQRLCAGRTNNNKQLFQSPACFNFLFAAHLPLLSIFFFLSSDLISQTKFIFVEKVPTFFVYKVFVGFFFLYQRRFLNDNNSLLRRF